MPEISRFLGIIIALFYQDHVPPHFHAKYGDFEITVTIEGGVVTGQFPRRALAHVLEWHALHQNELLENWKLAQERKPLKPIAPLE
ncbi:MAG: DUF4160 domain-containing protein [Acidobacteriota bacterium]